MNVASEATISHLKRSILTLTTVIQVPWDRKGKVEIMKKNLTEIVFILDRSGSMGGLESDTIGGYNSMLKKQKKEKGRP